MSRHVIFGGTGFIGTHLSQFLLANDPTCQVVLADLNPPRHAKYASELERALSSGRAKFVRCDVRHRIDASAVGDADVIFNLAAVHREPGHQPVEYFETNLYGAENVCDYASAVAAKHLVFTSSISVYGATEAPKTEASLTTPDSPYGSSKLVAENIHRKWQASASKRHLLILRPGVVFGPGEGGNVTRLIRSLVMGYFVYMGNRTTRKAGGYVKELCEVMRFAMAHQIAYGEGVTLLNFSMTPTATLDEFVQTVQRVAHLTRKPLSLPHSFLLALSYPIDSVTRGLGIKQPISPTRVRKLVRSTNIEARGLQLLGYQHRYPLSDALEDWKRENPTDFLRSNSRGKESALSEQNHQVRDTT